MRMHFTSEELQPNHEKNIGKVPTERHSTKCWPSTPENCQDHQKQGKYEKLPQPRGA